MNRRQALHELKGIAGEQGARWLLWNIAGPSGALGLDDALCGDETKRLQKALARLRAGEPLQYILGSWDFYGYRFKVDRRALIPRPETELLVEAALGVIKGADKPRVADLGAGTGCIGISVKLERPDASVALYDLSADACSLAKENAQHLGADVTVRNCDMRALCGQYELILSNPPYIKTEDIGALDESVRLFEPVAALDGGEDGLAFYRELEKIAGKCLAAGGWMVLEIGAGQRPGIEDIFRCYRIEFIKDLQGTDRIAVIQK